MGAAIFGVNFHDNFLVKAALQKFFAIGPLVAAKIMAKHTIFPLARIESLSAKKVTALTGELSSMVIETDARKIVRDSIHRLYNIGTYRGRRHAMTLPVRGQRTRNNNKTAHRFNKLDRMR